MSKLKVDPPPSLFTMNCMRCTCVCVLRWGGRTTEQSDKQQVQELKEWKITFSKSLVVEIWIHYTPYSLQNKNW